MVMDTTFWQGKRVFLTGHTGFKGSWLSLLLNRLGARTSGYALAPQSGPSLYEIAGIGATVQHSSVADIRDQSGLAFAMNAAQPEIVIHMAAQALVRRSYLDPVETFATNLMGTVNLLEAVRNLPSVRAVLIVTSDKCYENREWVWGYREDEALGGYDPYSSSKACAELATAAYRRSFFSGNATPIGVASARAGNVIGGGDWAEDRLIPDIMRAVARGESARIRNPSSIRPWQHVLEPLVGYLSLIQGLWGAPTEFSGAWNFGPAETDARSVEWIADEICRLWPGASWKRDVSSHPHEAHYLKLDCAKSRHGLGWRPTLDLAAALAWTVEWFQGFHETPAAAHSISMAQIDRYLSLIADT